MYFGLGLHFFPFTFEKLSLSHQVGDVLDEISVRRISSLYPEIHSQHFPYRDVVGSSGDVKVVSMLLVKGVVGKDSDLLFGLLLQTQASQGSLKLRKRQNVSSGFLYKLIKDFLS